MTKRGEAAIIYTVLPLLNNKHLAIFLLYPRKYELCFLHHLLFLLYERFRPLPYRPLQPQHPILYHSPYHHVYAFTSYFLKGMIYFFFHLLALRRTPKDKQALQLPSLLPSPIIKLDFPLSIIKF